MSVLQPTQRCLHVLTETPEATWDQVIATPNSTTQDPLGAILRGTRGLSWTLSRLAGAFVLPAEAVLNPKLHVAGAGTLGITAIGATAYVSGGNIVAAAELGRMTVASGATALGKCDENGDIDLSAVWVPGSTIYVSLQTQKDLDPEAPAEANTFTVSDFSITYELSVAPTLTTIETLAPGSGFSAAISYEQLAAASDLNDANEGQELVFRIESVASGSSLTKDGAAVVPGTTTLAAGESLVWTPPGGNWTAGDMEAFSVVGSDGELVSTPEVTVSVRGFGAGVIVGPIASSGGGATFSLLGASGKDLLLPLAAACKVVWPAAVDGNGDPLDLEGHELQFVCHDRFGAVLDSFAVSGDAAGVVSWDVADDDLIYARDAQYRVWDLTSNALVHQGRCAVCWVPAITSGGAFTVAGPQRVDLVLPQNATAAVTFPAAKDEDGEALDLAGKTLRLRVADELGRTLATPGSWSIDPGSGAGSVPTASFSAADLAAVREAHYRASVVETGHVLYWGTYRVELAPQSEP